MDEIIELVALWDGGKCAPVAEQLLELVASKIAETQSRIAELVESAVDAGYLVTMHVVVVPEALAVARVANQVSAGGHAVPEDKIRQRYVRLWPLVAAAIGAVDKVVVYDNSRAARPFRVVATFDHGSAVGEPDWPAWTPKMLRVARR